MFTRSIVVRNVCRVLVISVIHILCKPVAVAQATSHVVLSEIYGGGGNAGATFKNDFIELYNPTGSAVVMTNWSLQYATSAGVFTAGNRTIFSGTIASHGFFLIQEAQGSGGTVDLPTPDVIGTVALAATSGKIALAGDTMLVSGPTSSNVIDFVGYGSATQFEGSAAAPTLSSSTSGERKAQASSTQASMRSGGADSLAGNGLDSDQNSVDLLVRSIQNPQNSLSAHEDPPTPPPPTTHLVISEIYGGGGNAGAAYKNDFVELYNPTASSIVMNQWSVQYATVSGAFSAGNRTIVSGTIPAYSFFLIQEAQGAGGTLDLPTPDAAGTANLGATGGKVALVSDTVLITDHTTTGVVDFVGYGSANDFEGGGAVATLSNTTSGERKAKATSTPASMSGGGADSLSGNSWDSNNNSADFVVKGTQGPQNSSSPAEGLSGSTPATTVYSLRAGWNMISLPLIVGDPRKTTLFPFASSAAFRYNGTYVIDDTLQNAIGYWLKSDPARPDTVHGFTRPRDSVAVIDGWNLIGSLSASIPVSSVTSVPPGLVTSQFFSYEGSYVSSVTLEPGLAYWVKVNGTGTLFLASGASPENSLHIVPTTEDPPSAPGEGARNDETIPFDPVLAQNYPNPFNPSTTITFTLPQESFVTVTVYNTLGQAVAVLRDHELMDKGEKHVSFDARGLSSGVYAYRLTIDGPADVGARGNRSVVRVRNMIVLK